MKEIKRGEIYYADLSPVVGCEQDGVRPVVILQNDVGNRHSPTTIVAAITSKRTKINFPTHVAIQVEGLERDSMVLLEQIRTIDKARLLGYIGEADQVTLGKIDKAIQISFGLLQRVQMEGQATVYMRVARKEQLNESLGKEENFEDEFMRKEGPIHAFISL